jgi:dihydrofolate synthase/folylpolyglutamate synthase
MKTVTIRDASDAERYLESFIDHERTATLDYPRLGLERIAALLERLDHPERSLPSIHIAGSKGKGTVALTAEALLRAAGRRVGTYTSPHLVRWQERFRVAGQSVTPAELVAAVCKLQPVLEDLRADPALRPSFFDVSTALAFWLFRELGVDAGVVEVGLGGRLDSTNLTASRVSVLTTVQLEHTDKLGNTLAEIAAEKAGILRRGVPFLHGPLDPEALGALWARSSAEDADLEEVRARCLEMGADGQRIALDDGRELWASVIGRHQAVNLALAVRAVERYLGRALQPLELESLGRLRLPARLELVEPALLIDTAHTPDSASALCATLRELWPGRSCVLLLSVSRDKDAASIASALAPIARSCVVTRAEPRRSLAPEELEPLVWAAGVDAVECEEDPARAFARARELVAEGELLVVTGSVYLAGCALRVLDPERAIAQS